MSDPRCAGCGGNNNGRAGSALTRSSLAGSRRFGAVVVQDLMVQPVVEASKVHDTAFWSMLLTDEAFEAEGPYLEDFVIHAETRDMDANFEWRVLLQRRMHDGVWEPTSGITSADPPLGLQHSEGYATGPVYSDRARQGYRSRLVLQLHTKATGGGAPGGSAEISIAVAKRSFT